MEDTDNRVAVLITDVNGKVLIGRAPNQKTKWDLMKGHIEEGEELKTAACREAKEECGLDLDASQLTFINKCAYGDGYIYFYEYYLPEDGGDVLPRLKCTTYFKMYGKDFPEIKYYDFVDRSELGAKLYSGLVDSMKKVKII